MANQSSKMIKLNTKEVGELERLLRKSIIDSDNIEYIVKNIDLYNKLKSNLVELESLDIPF